MLWRVRKKIPNAFHYLHILTEPNALLPGCPIKDVWGSLLFLVLEDCCTITDVIPHGFDVGLVGIVEVLKVFTFVGLFVIPCFWVVNEIGDVNPGRNVDLLVDGVGFSTLSIMPLIGCFLENSSVKPKISAVLNTLS